MKRLVIVLLVLTFFVKVESQTEANWSQKISSGLVDKTLNGESVPFLIVLKDQANVLDARRLNTKDEKGTYVFQTLRDFAKGNQASVVADLEAQQISYTSFFIVNAIETNGNWSVIKQIAQRADVAKILDNAPLQNVQPVESYIDNGSSRSTIEWGIEKINADDVWALGYRGQGVVVGGEDTGYDWTHPALKKKYRGYIEDLDTANHNYNWHDAIHMISPLNSDSLNPCGLDVKEPCDDHGHGTHTMGTMIGSDGDNEIGVAPDAKWCACRNMERGWGSPFTYLECFQWFLAPTDLNNENPDPLRAPHVINNSWGCPPVEGCDTSNFELLEIGVNNLRAAGVVVVVSAGNEGPNCSSVESPAAIFEGSFAIGATAPNDTIAGFSSRGPVAVDSSFRMKPNVSAPGVGVRSARPGGNYGFSSGTSMASPHVVGLVALVISANPELAGKVEVIETLIEQTAIPKTTEQQCGDTPGDAVPNNTYGFGRVDALAAVNAAIALIGVGTSDEQDASPTLLFPNPTTGKIFIENKYATQKMAVQIFNLDGQIIANTLSAQSLLTIDISNAPPGIYFYQIQQGGKLSAGKVVKK